MSNSTSNLDLIASSQSSKEVVANALFDAMSANALFGRRASTTTGLTWGYYGGSFQKGDFTLTQIANGVITLTASATNYLFVDSVGVVTKATAAPTGWPAPLASNAIALYEIIVGTSTVTSYIDHRARLRGSGTASVATKGDLLTFDTAATQLAVGTNGQVLTADSAQAKGIKWSSAPFDIHTYFPGIPAASSKLYRGKLARAVVFLANFSGAQFSASANATASTVFDIQKNGSSVGSCTIAAGGTTPTFASSGGASVSFAAGDLLAIIAPATPDTTLADPAITLSGTR